MWVAASMFANFKRIQRRPGANAIARAAAILWAAGAALMGASAAPGEVVPWPAPLRSGESISYSVRWGIIPFVGTIDIAADEIGSGSDAVLRVTTTTSTGGLARGFFPFDARGESVYMKRSGRLLSSSEWSSYRDKVVKNSIVFNYDRELAVYTDDVHPEKSRSIPMPPTNPSDLILALIQTRVWNLRPGEQRDTLVIFGDQFFPLTIHAEGYEYVNTGIGYFKALALVPRMEKTAPIGMFRHGSTVKVWIETDDDRHLPVKFSVGFRFGTGTATLIDYQPPK
jgi:hypothetical protein